MPTRSTGWLATATILAVVALPQGCTTRSDAAGYSIGGTVSGLTGSGLALASPGQPDLLVVLGQGAFTFANRAETGASYRVTVFSQPTGQACAVAHGWGTVGSASVTDISVTCGAATVGTGRFSSTGSMSTARTDHTATLMSDGAVLVVGGKAPGLQIGEEPALGSAERFDPHLGSFGLVGSMSIGRTGHSATLLPTGEVLVVGGWSSPGGGTALASAELFDPLTGSFVSTGSMSTARAGHTTTLLPDGQVLVLGGRGASAALRDAELYDRAAGLFHPAGTMMEARVGHTATLLPSGMVLILGGVDSGLAAAGGAELHDPSTGTFFPTGSPTVTRNGATATVLPGGQVLVLGGSSGFTVYADAELFDPATGRFTPSGRMGRPRSGHAASLLPGGMVLVTGGQSALLPPETLIAEAELFDPATGVFLPAGAALQARLHHTSTLLPTGEALIVGGVQGYVGSGHHPIPSQGAELYSR